jgi:hypothetical protein
MAYIGPEKMSQITPFLTGTPPVALAELSRHLGLNVLESDLGPNISGMLIRNDSFEGITPSASGWSVVVNAKEGERRKRFTVAHEIGHFMLHRNLRELQDGILEDDTFYRSELGNVRETEANRFAADLLMPVNLVMAAYKQNPDIKALADMFEVSEAAMRVRIDFCGRNGFLQS